MPSLERQSLDAAITILAERDSVLSGLSQRWGAPPLWRRPASFRTLVLIVMEQKISLASARAVMQRIDVLCQPFTPQAFLAVDPLMFREAGASHAKIDYCRSIAAALLEKRLVLKSLNTKADAEVIDALVAVRGIGPWTAGVYLTMALCRPDAWPSGDRALAVSVAENWGLDTVPDYPSLDARADAWRPYRGAASRLLWHAYLLRRG
jgi:DNA-3-methyladenine glycosylase II